MKTKIVHSALFPLLGPKATADVERILYFYASKAMQCDTGPELHDAMKRGAEREFFDENTGGGVWLSYTIDVIGTESQPVLIIAGTDSCGVYMVGEYSAVYNIDPQAEAARIWNLCGEDDGVLIASAYLEA